MIYNNLMKIPGFPIFAEVDLSSKSIISDFLSSHPLEASEYTFTNIFAYRKTYNFKVSLLRDNLIILKDTDPVSFFCPVGEFGSQDLLTELRHYLRDSKTGPLCERVPEGFVEAYLRNEEDLLIEEDRDNFDYVYHVRELIELRGSKFHDKKNKVNHFRNTYEYEYITLTPDLVEECLLFEDYWCQVKECGKIPGLEKERCAILEMLNNFEALGAHGGVIKVWGKIAALTIGEKMLSDTFVIHVEKANPDLPGLYQVINQEFLMHEANDCRFVNREQDLGIHGLRNAKMTYNPVRFVKKYKVSERSG
jgi:hypothetical protein